MPIKLLAGICEVLNFPTIPHRPASEKYYWAGMYSTLVIASPPVSFLSYIESRFMLKIFSCNFSNTSFVISKSCDVAFSSISTGVRISVRVSPPPSGYVITNPPSNGLAIIAPSPSTLCRAGSKLTRSVPPVEISSGSHKFTLFHMLYV